LVSARAERRLTEPPMLPSICDASADFITSAPWIVSDGSTSNANSRPSPSVASTRPLSVTMLYSGPRPRTFTYWPSPPWVREIVTPVTCDSESATLSSGKRPRSSAAIESCTTAELRFSSRAFSRLARVPVTVIFCGASGSAGSVGDGAAAASEAGVGADGVCAIAPSGQTAAIAAATTVNAQRSDCRRTILLSFSEWIHAKAKTTKQTMLLFAFV
jgi:hypothetical protein